MPEGSSEDLGLTSVGTEEFAGALTAPALAGGRESARAALEFEVGSASA